MQQVEKTSTKSQRSRRNVLKTGLKPEIKKPVSYSTDTPKPPVVINRDLYSDMHMFIRALLLRRPDAAIDKAVKENRWKDAYELEIKYQQEWVGMAIATIAADGPGFAEPVTHELRRGRPPPCTSDEYVEDRDPHIRIVLQKCPNCTNPPIMAIPNPVPHPDGPLHKVEIAGPPHKKGRGKAGKKK